MKEQLNALIIAAAIVAGAYVIKPPSIGGDAVATRGDTGSVFQVSQGRIRHCLLTPDKTSKGAVVKIDGTEYGVSSSLSPEAAMKAAMEVKETGVETADVWRTYPTFRPYCGPWVN